MEEVRGKNLREEETRTEKAIRTQGSRDLRPTRRELSWIGTESKPRTKQAKPRALPSMTKGEKLSTNSIPSA